MGETVQVPSPFGPEQADAWFAAWGQMKDAEGLAMSFSHGYEINPAGFVLIRSAAQSRANVKLRFPERLPKPKVYLQLNGLADFRSGREFADRVGDDLEDKLGNQPSSALRAARFAVEELAANIVQHSERPETACGMARAYPEAGRFQIAFADAGIGLKASLEKNLEFQGRVADDADAIRLAITKGVTRNGKGNLGIGLSFLTDLSDRLGGDLWIASGTALMHRHGPHEARQSEFRTIAPWQGVWICLDAPATP